MLVNVKNNFFVYRMPSDEEKSISRFLKIMKKNGIDYKSLYE